jgi:hypothetical protein
MQYGVQQKYGPRDVLRTECMTDACKFYTHVLGLWDTYFIPFELWTRNFAGRDDEWEGKGDIEGEEVEREEDEEGVVKEKGKMRIEKWGE